MGFKKTLIQRLAVKLITGPAKFVMLFGGSRSGKSFILVYIMVVIASKFAGSRQLIARLRFNHIKTTIWSDTLPKVLKICFPELIVVWNNVDYFITLPNGSEIWIAGLDEKTRTEKILGMEFLNIFLNECSQIAYGSVEVVMSRLAQLITYTDANGVERQARNQMFFDENPPNKKHWSYKMFVMFENPEDRTKLDRRKYANMQMNPKDNLKNIARDYMDTLASMSKSKQRRFRDGEFADDSLQAYWTSEQIARNRVHVLPKLKRIVVAIDPAVTSDPKDSDETGIVVRGVDFADHLYLLEDLSGVYTPNQWAQVSVKAYHDWKADKVVAEVNNGGDLVEMAIRTVDKHIPYMKVFATRDKGTRAEPVAAFAERGMDHMYGEHPEMESEMTTWEGKAGEKSPNRIDANVWGAAALIPEIMNAVKRPKIK